MLHTCILHSQKGNIESKIKSFCLFFPAEELLLNIPKMSLAFNLFIREVMELFFNIWRAALHLIAVVRGCMSNI